MNESQAGPNNLLDTTDCLEAVGVFKGWKNFLFVIVFLCLLLLQLSFWLVDTGSIKISPPAGGSQQAVISKPAVGSEQAVTGGVTKVNEGNAAPPVNRSTVRRFIRPIRRSVVAPNEPAKTITPEKTAEPEKTPEPQKAVEPKEVNEPAKAVEPNEAAEPNKAAEPAKIAEPNEAAEPNKAPEPNAPAEKVSDAGQYNLQLAMAWPPTELFSGITFEYLSWVIRIVNAVLILTASLYCLSMLFSLKVSMLGRLGGINHISRAFFLSLLMLVLLLPWQRIFGGMVPGAIFTPEELVKWSSAEHSDMLDKVVYYLRFCGYWLLIMLLLILSQIRSIRWGKAILRRLEII
jgi:outer membrane biosynthesis protein TonB